MNSLNESLSSRVLHVPIEKLNRPLHGRAEIIRDVVIISIIFIEFYILIDLQHLIKQQFREFQWYILIERTMM